jgi:hypothetical protein
MLLTCSIRIHRVLFQQNVPRALKGLTLALLQLVLDNGRFTDLDTDNWDEIASATHVALCGDDYVADRLVVRTNPDGQFLVCAELTTPSGPVVYGELPDDSLAVMAAMARITRRYGLPSWMVERCLTQLRRCG